METTKLSTKGQVIIPRSIRAAHNWSPGLELEVIDSNDSIILRPKKPFNETNIDDVAGCLNYTGKAKSIDDMDLAIMKGVKHNDDSR